MFKPQTHRIPVMAGSRLVEMADPQRAAVLAHAENVRLILRHKRHLVEIQLLDYGDCSRISRKWGRPQQLSTKNESDDNPRGVWKFKRLPR